MTSFPAVSHNGYSLHLIGSDGRTRCGKPVDPKDTYRTHEAGERAWRDGRQRHCGTCTLALERD